MFLPLDHLVRLAAQAGWDPPVPYSYGNGADDIQSPIPVPNLGRAHLGGPAWQPYPPWQCGLVGETPRHVVNMCVYLCIVQRYGPTFFVYLRRPICAHSAFRWLPTASVLQTPVSRLA